MNPTPEAAGPSNPPPPPAPDPRIVALAHKYPKGSDLTQAQRTEAYLGIGAIMPRATRVGSRRTAYGKDPVAAFVEAWNAAGGMALSGTTAKLCRQVYTTLEEGGLIDAITRAHIPWTALRELCQTRVTPQTRAKLVDELCRGTLRPNQVPARIDQECDWSPRKERLPADRVIALKQIYADVVKLGKALEGSAGLVQEALGSNEPASRDVIAAITTGLRASLSKWRHELKAARRRRKPGVP